MILQGEASILLRNTIIATALPIAKTDCLVACIDQVSFMSLLRHVPEFKFHVMNVMADRLQKTYEMIESG
ncbi:MAG: hypothetical protein ACREDU_11065 [Methylocella sp.]